MAGHEKVFQGIQIGKYENDDKKLSKDLHKYLKGDITIICIGTDRSTGDSFAPFVGSLLQERGYENVIGTIDYPVHGVNLEERIKEIPEGNLVLAIDSCLGMKSNIGKLFLNSGKLQPGAALGKNLNCVGDFNIKGVVNVTTDDAEINYKLLGATRLSSVLKMARYCVHSIEEAFPLSIEEFDTSSFTSQLLQVY